MCWNLPAVFSNIVDIFRGLTKKNKTKKKKPKYYEMRNKCGNLVLHYMIVGITLEWLAFSKRTPPFCDRGEIYLFFPLFFFSFFKHVCILEPELKKK